MINILTAEYKKTFWSTSMVLFVSIILYFILISCNVFNAVSLKDSEIKMTDTKAKLAVLESKYIVYENSISEERATELGFSAVKGNLFSYAGYTSAVSLSGN